MKTARQALVCILLAFPVFPSILCGADLYLFSSHDLSRFESSSGDFIAPVGTYSQAWGTGIKAGPASALYTMGDAGLWRINPGSGSAQEYIQFYSGGSPINAGPGGFDFTGDGGLYIFSAHQLFHYNGNSGAFLNTVGTYNQVYGGSLKFGPDGLLYSLGDSGLWRIDVSSGAGEEFLPFFNANSPVVATPTGFAFAADSSLYLFSQHDLFHFAASGEYLGKVGTFNQVWGNSMQFGPDGLLYTLGDSGLWRIDTATQTAQELIPSSGWPAAGSPTGFTIVPEPSSANLLIVCIAFTLVTFRKTRNLGHHRG